MKNKKIGIIVISIVILITVSLILYQEPASTISTVDTSEVILTNSDYIESLSSTPVMIGNFDAPVTIFAFNDYQCQSCKYWYENEYPEISENLIKTNKANIIFLDASPLGDDSILISQATFCANDQGKYSEYQEILFSQQKEIDSWAKYEQLKKFAMDLNLSMSQFENCLDSGKYEKDVKSNIEYTINLGVQKIPIFKIVNFEGKDFLLKGSISSNLFENTVNQFQN